MKLTRVGYVYLFKILLGLLKDQTRVHIKYYNPFAVIEYSNVFGSQGRI